MRTVYERNVELATALARANMTHLDLASQAGVNIVTISRLANGRQRPVRETAERIAAALGVEHPTDLFPEYAEKGGRR